MRGERKQDLGGGRRNGNPSKVERKKGSGKRAMTGSGGGGERGDREVVQERGRRIEGQSTERLGRVKALHSQWEYQCIPAGSWLGQWETPYAST